ncbi:MAG: hypothetical protein E4G89_00460 [Methanothrix sp.]|nr:MAG: hypothetical protein E4G89_00460 [Methanothrix sp.]
MLYKFILPDSPIWAASPYCQTADLDLAEEAMNCSSKTLEGDMAVIIRGAFSPVMAGDNKSFGITFLCGG